ncbi:GMC oxidoreductase [Williamsia serinedens]|uniref:Cholesterol oxidase n=1 Tax=Williamsia serinedens TaxID=391736 RepID=A0ABT1H0A3_9NOCA|nr:GMC family oxidoreductase [Williamsia serinedens]MCP2160561.1 cholesterol oxidase [Williamsia serinedens]
MSSDIDWLVVGSGFGGSVAALRLAEKGYDVCVMEKGRRFDDHDFAENAWQADRLLWAPLAGLRGIMAMTPLKHVTVLSGVGVGGGSLVYGNTLYTPHSDDFYRHPQWADLADWRTELTPHFATAKRMLGVTTFVGEGPSENLLAEIAGDLGCSDRVHTTDVGVFFGTPGVTVADPYFDGAGPARTGCVRCGQCMLGCRHNAKNTLTKNYLHLAERAGVRVEAERTVVDIRPLGAADGSDGYAVTTQRSGAWIRRDRRTVTTHGVVVAGGALGTTTLLQKLREKGSLPHLSHRLGHLVRTNSEAIVAVISDDPDADLRTDIAITTSVHPDDQTHFTNNTYGAGGNAMGLTFGPLTGGRLRILQFILAVLRHPTRWLLPSRLRDWSRRSVVFTIMQSTDTALRLRRGHFGLVTTDKGDGDLPEGDLPIARRIAESAVRHLGGHASTAVTESLLARPTTAHILGGAVMAADRVHGVVDRHHRAFGYQNLLITDGAAIPANPGVNPSLTITAMAEEAMSHVPEKSSRADGAQRTHLEAAR